MINFKDLREKKIKGMPAGEHVFDKKVNGVSVMIHKDKGKFVVYIDNEKLDSFTSKSAAQKFGIEFAKEYKK
jgi:hypothetical protein